MADTAPQPPADILLVDDRPANLLALEAVFSDLGETLVRAASGDEALRLLGERDFAVVLLDVRMPGLSGFETAQRMRTSDRTRHTPVIFLSAAESPEFPVAEAYRLGAVDFLVKPLVPDILRAKVAVFVDLYRKGERLRALERRERERTEEALRETERRFARFMEHLPGLAWIKDLAGRYLFANGAAERAFGTPRAGLYGKTDEEVFPPETAARFRENDRRAAETPAGVQVVETLAHPDGSVHHSLVSKFPIPGPDGRPALVGGVAIDATEQMVAEAALRESGERLRRHEAELRLVTDCAPVYLARVDPDGRLVFVNRRYAARFGLTPEQVVGRRIAEVVGGTAYESFRRYVDEATAGRAVEFETVVPYPAGPRVMHCAYVPEPGAAGGRTGFVAVIRDVTEQREAKAARHRAEARALAILESITEGFVVLDADWNLAYVNAAFEQMTGTRRADVVGRNYWDVYPATAGTRLEAEYRRVAATGQTAEFENYYEPWDRWFAVKAYPAPGGGLCVQVNDVTAARRAQEALRESEGRQRKLADNLPAGFIYQIVQAADGSRRFTYVSAGVEAVCGVTPAEVLADPAALYGRIAEDDQPRVRAAEDAADHRADGQFDCEFRVRGRGGEVRWLHCRSAPRGLPGGGAVWDGVALDVTGRKATEEAVTEAARRKDQFMAMLAHELRNPLAPVRNALQLLALRGNDPTVLEKARGMMDRQVTHLGRLVDDLLDVSRLTTGKVQLRRERLDLARVARQAAADHRAAFEAKGVSVQVAAPDDPVAVSGDPTRLAQVLDNLLTNALKFTPRGGHVSVSGGGGSAVLTVRDTGAGRAGRSRRVLVVEDNRDAADSLRMLLEAYGYPVEVAYTGPDGVRAAERYRPEVVICDIGLPGMDGYRVAEALRGNPATAAARLIALTGYGQDEDRRRAKEAGFDEHLTKPVDPTALEAVIAAG
ncbi:MAG: PAS domain-containing protein [Gemmataceae bacterium]|nr:PAS domain-containing protein [Gemmataceae bacterium]